MVIYVDPISIVSYCGKQDITNKQTNSKRIIVASNDSLFSYEIMCIHVCTYIGEPFIYLCTRKYMQKKKIKIINLM